MCALFVMAVNAYSANGSDTVIVSSSIQTSVVNTLYPNAVTQCGTATLPRIQLLGQVWYSTMDTSDYYSRFFWNDDEYIVWYNGSWIHPTQRIDDSKILDAVSQAIRREHSGFIITDVDIEHEDKQQLYEVKLDKGNTRWNVLYTPTDTG